MYSLQFYFILSPSLKVLNIETYDFLKYTEQVVVCILSNQTKLLTP